MFYIQNGILQKISDWNGYYQPHEISVSFTLKRKLVAYNFYEGFICQNFYIKNNFESRVEFNVLEELGNLRLLDDLISNFT